MSSGAAPPQKPVKIPSHLRHGSSYVYRHYKCRCRRCQNWRRKYDRKRDHATRHGDRERQKSTRSKWYVCVSQWGVTHAEHEYNRIRNCVRCGAGQATEEFWERKWQGS